MYVELDACPSGQSFRPFSQKDWLRPWGAPEGGQVSPQEPYKNWCFSALAVVESPIGFQR